jgi:hypothetical protein
MTPKEKALELFTSYLNVGMGDGWAKQSALIAADEVLRFMGSDGGLEFWTEVKQEIEKL